MIGGYDAYRVPSAPFTRTVPEVPMGSLVAQSMSIQVVCPNPRPEMGGAGHVQHCLRLYLAELGMLWRIIVNEVQLVHGSMNTNV